MQKIAPDIFRQRLLIEGYYQTEVNKETINKFFVDICEYLNLRMYGEPIIFSPAGQGKEENQGYDAFVPLIDSGISMYVWVNKKFVSIVLYTCKKFDNKKALEFTKEFFEMKEIVHDIF